jgi:hypothetical protein
MQIMGTKKRNVATLILPEGKISNVYSRGEDGDGAHSQQRQYHAPHNVANFGYGASCPILVHTAWLLISIIEEYRA